jgi:hypothetical protein
MTTRGIFDFKGDIALFVSRRSEGSRFHVLAGIAAILGIHVCYPNTA